MNKKILVTGGAGFIGSNLVDILMKDGHTVVVLDNLSSGSMANISPWEGHPNFEFKEGDLMELRDIEQALAGCEIVYHLAANPEARTGYSDTSVDFEQNIQATQNLLTALTKSSQRVRLIFSSTSSVYGEPGIIPTPEVYGPLKPISLYGASKLACESLISGYTHMFGFESAILRLANVIGPRSNRGVVFDFVRKLQKNPKELEVLGDGTQTKSYLHVYDCVRAFVTALDWTQREMEILNVGSEDAVTVLEIARIVANELGLRNVAFRCKGGVDGGRGWKGDVKEMLLDTKKIRASGWKATWSSSAAVRLVAQGMAKMLVPASSVFGD